MKASEMFEARPSTMVLVYGDSGSGKTTWTVLSPGVLLLALEKHSLASVVRANPDAEVVLVNSWKTLRSTVDRLKTGRPVVLENGQPAFEVAGSSGPFRFQTLVLDGLTEMMEMLKAHVVHGDSTEENRRRTAKTNPTLDQWGTLGGLGRDLLRDLRGLDVNVVCTALAEHETDETSCRHTRPAVQGSLGRTVSQWFSGVAYAQKARLDERRVQYVLDFELAGAVTKPVPGCATRLQVDLAVPGKTTLGSLLLAGFPGVSVAHRESDRPEYAGGEPLPETPETATENAEGGENG